LAEKIFYIEQIEKPRPRNSTNKPPFILYQWRIRSASQRNPESRAPHKKWRPFLDNTRFRKKYTFPKKFQAIFVRKILHSGPHLFSIPPCLIYRETRRIPELL